MRKFDDDHELYAYYYRVRIREEKKKGELLHRRQHDGNVHVGKKFASRKIQSRYGLAIKAIGITVIVISDARRASTVNVFTFEVMTRSTILVISSWFKRLNDVVKHAELRERARHAMLDCDANRWKSIRPPKRDTRVANFRQSYRRDGCQILMRQQRKVSACY